MSNILKLRPWLTVDESAKYLTGVLKEDVEPAEILRFALDGLLTLSVDILHRPRARVGRMVPIGEAVVTKLPQIPNRPELPKEFVDGIRTADGESIVQFGDEEVLVEGIWDLPMYGGERLDVESLYLQASGLPSPSMINLDGAFLVHPDENQWLQLRESFEPDPVARGSRAWGSRTYPAVTLPVDSTLVVRRGSLETFIGKFLDSVKKAAAKPAAAGRWWEQHPILEWAENIAARRHERKVLTGKNHIAEEIARRIEGIEKDNGMNRKISGNTIKKVCLTKWKFIPPA